MHQQLFCSQFEFKNHNPGAVLVIENAASGWHRNAAIEAGPQFEQSTRVIPAFAANAEVHIIEVAKKTFLTIREAPLRKTC